MLIVYPPESLSHIDKSQKIYRVDNSDYKEFTVILVIQVGDIMLHDGSKQTWLMEKGRQPITDYNNTRILLHI